MNHEVVKQNYLNNSKLFGYADIGRFGLGHSLLAWARCVVWCHKTGATMLAPHWFRFRLGPYIRREYDKREYFRLFKHEGYVHGWERLRLLLFSTKINAEMNLPDRAFSPSSPTLVIFRNAVAGNENMHFHEIRGYQDLLLNRLKSITRDKYKPTPVFEPFVAIHVRLGDFTKIDKLDVARQGLHNVRLPVKWYANILEGLRQRTGLKLPAIVFSDGEDKELYPLLQLPAVKRSPVQSSITDLLSISEAQLLISSGSGFSTWGSFLGQVPRICFPGQIRVTILDRMEDEIESETEKNISDTFIENTIARFNTSVSNK